MPDESEEILNMKPVHLTQILRPLVSTQQGSNHHIQTRTKPWLTGACTLNSRSNGNFLLSCLWIEIVSNRALPVL